MADKKKSTVRTRIHKDLFVDIKKTQMDFGMKGITLTQKDASKFLSDKLNKKRRKPITIL